MKFDGYKEHRKRIVERDWSVSDSDGGDGTWRRSNWNVHASRTLSRKLGRVQISKACSTSRIHRPPSGHHTNNRCNRNVRKLQRCDGSTSRAINGGTRFHTESASAEPPWRRLRGLSSTWTDTHEKPSKNIQGRHAYYCMGMDISRGGDAILRGGRGTRGRHLESIPQFSTPTKITNFNFFNPKEPTSVISLLENDI